MPCPGAILQICHDYHGPFADCARQYASLFRDTSRKVVTVFLKGEPNEKIARETASDEVIFLDFRSSELRHLKLKAIREIRRVAAARDFAFCIAHRFKSIYAALLGTNLKVVGVHHAFGDYDRMSRRWFAGFFRDRLSLLGVSDAVRDDLRRRLPNWSPESIETLHNHIDPESVRAEILDRKAARAALGLPDEVVVIGNVGRLHPDKDQKTLLSGFALALPRLPSGAVLAIVGRGPLEAALKAQAEKLGIAERVIFPGQIPEMRRLFKAFDLFVLSSDHEPFGMVLLEAAAAETPIMTTDCGGAPEIVVDGNFRFPLGDSGTLAEKLAAFFSAPPAGGVPSDWLRERFSDEAARRRFFALPMIRKALGS